MFAAPDLRCGLEQANGSSPSSQAVRSTHRDFRVRLAKDAWVWARVVWEFGKVVEVARTRGTRDTCSVRSTELEIELWRVWCGEER